MTVNMISSMVRAASGHVRRTGPTHDRLVRGAVVLAATFAATLAAWLVPGNSLPGYAQSSACVATLTSPSVLASLPWPQQRYDLVWLHQLTDGAGVTVAVVDSGVDATHPQLTGAVRSGADLLGRGDGRRDCVGHGTAVSSIIAARPVAGMGLLGLAPGVTILPIRVSERLQPLGDASPALAGAGAAGEPGGIAELAAGVHAAVVSRPRPAVISLSISTPGDDPLLRKAIREALAADIVVVAAVGNQYHRGNPVPYPAAYDGVLGVGAVGPDGARLATSQVGAYVDLVAPGDLVVGAVPGGGHLELQGTSFAVPFVSATAALIRARWPSLNRVGVMRRLVATTDPPAGARPSTEYGFGVLNPLRALTEVVPLSAAEPTLPATVVTGADGPNAGAPGTAGASWPPGSGTPSTGGFGTPVPGLPVPPGRVTTDVPMGPRALTLWVSLALVGVALALAVGVAVLPARRAGSGRLRLTQRGN